MNQDHMIWVLPLKEQAEERLVVRRTKIRGQRPDPRKGLAGGDGCRNQKARLDGGDLRMVTARRKRALQKKGHYVRWSTDLGWYVWRMSDKPIVLSFNCKEP